MSRWLTRVSPIQTCARSITTAPEIEEVEPVQGRGPDVGLEHRRVGLRVARQCSPALLAVESYLVREQLELQSIVIGAGIEPGDEVDRALQRVSEQPRAGREQRVVAEESRRHHP